MIVGLYGALLGVLLGIVLGLALVRALDRQGVTAAVVPVTTLLVLTVVIALLGVLASIYPARTREVRAWLRTPDGSIPGIWFVSDGPDTSTVSARGR
jgi:hypothetical protein